MEEDEISCVCRWRNAHQTRARIHSLPDRPPPQYIQDAAFSDQLLSLSNMHLSFFHVFSLCVFVCVRVCLYLTHIVVVPLMKALCLQGEKKKNLLVFPHDCQTITASTRSPSPVPGKVAGLAGICIIVFRAIVGGFGLLTQSRRLATCPEQMNSAFVQHAYLFLHSVISEQ